MATILGRLIGADRDPEGSRIPTQTIWRASRHRLVRRRHVLRNRRVIGRHEAARVAGDPLALGEDADRGGGEKHIHLGVQQTVRDRIVV